MDDGQVQALTLGVGLLLVLAFVALPSGAARDVLYAAGAGLSVLGVEAGLRRQHPDRQLPWRLIQAALAVNALGEVVFVGYLHVLGRPPFPGPASWCYVAAYLLMAAAMVAVGQTRRRGAPRHLHGSRGPLLDAATVTVAVGLPMWLFLVRPAVSSNSVAMDARLAVAGYSLCAAVVAAQLLGLVTGRVRPSTSLQLLAAAGGLGLVSTLAFQVLTLLGHVPYGWVNPGLLLAFTLTAMAALHPSMRLLLDPLMEVDGAPSTARVALLGGALLVPPVSLAVGLSRSVPADAADGWAVLGGGAAVSLLVLGRMAGLLRQVHVQARQLAALAGTDPLTGLPNRRGFDEAVAAALASAGRQAAGTPGLSAPALVMLDLDHFKSVNDTHGHAAGDAVLRSAARAWRQRLRAGDVLVRMGGEEFAALLPTSSSTEAVQVAEDLRRATPTGITVSAGVALWCGEDVPVLLGRADRALYQAKREGRDRVVCAAPAPDLRAASPSRAA